MLIYGNGFTAKFAVLFIKKIVPKNTEGQTPGSSSDQRTGLDPSNVPPAWSLLWRIGRKRRRKRKSRVCSPVVVFCRSSERFCSRGLVLPVLVSLTCWHLLGASLSHRAGSSPSACDETQKEALPPASWQEPPLRPPGGYGMREVMSRCPRPPRLFLLFIFSLGWCHSPEESGCHCQGDRADCALQRRYTARSEVNDDLPHHLWQATKEGGGKKKRFTASPLEDLIKSARPPTLPLLCIPACTDLSLSWISYSLSAPSAPCAPPLPNYSTRRSRTPQHTPQTSTASDYFK